MSTVYGYRRAGVGIAAVMAGALLLRAVPAGAQTSEGNRIAAETLFNEARKLMGESKFDEACPKFADSQRLDPGVGTLLNLALCYKKAGKTASAWSTYRDAAAAARVAGQNEREDMARQEASNLEPTLSKLSLTVKTATDALDIKLDGSSVPKSLWSVPMPVDPGDHAVQASATGYKPWSGHVSVASGAAASLDIPALVVDTSAKSSSGQGTVPATHDQVSAHANGGNTQRTLALVAGGIGVVGLGVGGFFGLSAKSRYKDSDPYCDASNNCSQRGVDIRNEALGKATVSTVAFGVGAAALVGAGVLWFTAPSGPKKESAALRWDVAAGPSVDGWNASIGGTW